MVADKQEINAVKAATLIGSAVTSYILKPLQTS